MSNISKEDIKKISRLARIAVPSEEQEALAQKLETIINWAAVLEEVNTDNVLPVTNVHNSSLRLNPDQVSDGNIANEILKNTKNEKYGYFTIKKVIE